MTDVPLDVARAANSNMKARSKSRGRNVAATADDFKFGGLLGEGSYSTVRLPADLSVPSLTKHHNGHR